MLFAPFAERTLSIFEMVDKGILFALNYLSIDVT